MFDVTIALGIISFLLATILSIVSYLYISQRRDMNHRIGRLERALIDNTAKDEVNRKELEAKIENHYAFKSETIHLREMIARIDKDFDEIKAEVIKGNNLLTEVLFEIKKG